MKEEIVSRTERWIISLFWLLLKNVFCVAPRGGLCIGDSDNHSYDVTEVLSGFQNVEGEEQPVGVLCFHHKADERRDVA